VTEIKRRLAEIVAVLAEVTGGNLDVQIQETADDEVGILEQILNETVLNMKFARQGLGEQKETLEEKFREKNHALGERVKELNCLYGISNIIEAKGVTNPAIFQEIVDLIPLSWQYPESTCARITVDDDVVISGAFKETPWKQASEILLHC